MTEAERRYRKEKQKRIYINLTVADYNRWSDYASLKLLPLATMIRSAVESEITELEDSFDSNVSDIYEYQNSLKKVQVNEHEQEAHQDAKI